MLANDLKMWLAAFGYLTLLYLMVRPGSLGPQIVESISVGFGNLIRAASGQTLQPMPTIGT
jgi:hypothetical protein